MAAGTVVPGASIGVGEEAGLGTVLYVATVLASLVLLRRSPREADMAGRLASLGRPIVGRESHWPWCACRQWEVVSGLPYSITWRSGGVERWLC